MGSNARRFDVEYALSTLSRYSAAPRQGHLRAAERVMGYLQEFPKGRIIVDAGEPMIRDKMALSHGLDWSEFYPDACEEVPDNVPPPFGKACTITCYVDADHARDKVTRRSTTGIILLINNTPMYWASQRQKTVETSTYGSELVAAKTAVELIISMRYKLRMLGVKLEDTSLLVGDNMSVVLNTTIPSSMMKKKHNACAYHKVREAIAGRIINFGHIDTKQNISDLCTKPLGNMDFHRLTSTYLFRRSKASLGDVPS